MTKNAVFRTDASVTIGTGHVIRCLALAKALQCRGWNCVFASNKQTELVAPAFVNAKLEVLVVSADDDVAVMMERWPDGSDILVVDHYELDASYEKACRPWARRILVIDDLPNRRHDCDLLLDATLGRSANVYDAYVPESCGVMAGSSFALLRPEFAEVRQENAHKKLPRRILVTLGGTDPHNVTGAVLAGLDGLELSIDVVLGPSAPYLDKLYSTAACMGEHVTIHTNLGGREIAKLMANADLAVGAGGSSAWERCALGLPSLLVVIADNQRELATSLANRGAARLLGEADSLRPETVRSAVEDLIATPECLAKMAQAAEQTCDAHGATRVATMLSGQMSRDGGTVTLRPVARMDRDLILAWQRNPITRRHFHERTPPSPTEHEAWFETQRNDPKARLYIIEHDGTPSGVLRLDDADRQDTLPSLVVSIFVAPNFHRRGIGFAALHIVHDMWPESPFLANVKADNEASQRLFKAAGYKPIRDGIHNYFRAPQIESVTAPISVETENENC